MSKSNSPAAATIHHLFVYRAVQQRTGLSQEAMLQLTKRSFFSGTTQEEAIKQMERYCEQYTHSLVEILLKHYPHEFPHALVRLEARQALLMQCTSLTPEACMECFTKNPWLIACGTTGFSALLSFIRSNAPPNKEQFQELFTAFRQSTPETKSIIHQSPFEQLIGSFYLWKPKKVEMSDTIRRRFNKPEEDIIRFITELQKHDWPPKAIRRTFDPKHGRAQREAGVEHVIAVQEAVEASGFSRDQAIEIVSRASPIFLFSLEEIRETLPLLLSEPFDKFIWHLQRVKKTKELLQRMMKTEEEKEKEREREKQAEQARERAARIHATQTIAQAFAEAGWSDEDRDAHLRAFPFVQEIAPRLLALTLLQIDEYLDMRGAAWTKRLQATHQFLNEWHERLWGAAPDPSWGESIIRSLHEISTNAEPERMVNRCIARLVGATNPLSKLEDAALAQKRQEAIAQLREMPGWMAYQGQPLSMLQDLHHRWSVPHERIQEHVKAPWSLLILLEPPDQIQEAVNRYRSDAAIHSQNTESNPLDPLRDLRRLCIPYQEIRRRWTFVERHMPHWQLVPLEKFADAFYEPNPTLFQQRMNAFDALIAKRREEEEEREEEAQERRAQRAAEAKNRRKKK